MEDLITWLRGVLDDDETAAKAATPGPWGAQPGGQGTFDNEWEVVSDAHEHPHPGHYVVYTGYEGGGASSEQNALHIARHDPRQVLADIAAKRAILDAYLPEDGDPHPGLPCINYEGQNPEHYSEWDTCSRHIKANETLIRQDFVIRLLASGYRHRPGWQDSWEE